MSDTTILANTGLLIFLIACTVQSTAATSMLFYKECFDEYPWRFSTACDDSLDS